MSDSIEITIFKNIFQSISDEMGKILQHSAFSPNIKERNDFSCALFTNRGESFSFGTHIPVHLGAMPLSVRAALKEVKMEEGDMIILNDPYKGGTHLPDITLISPLFYKDKLLFIVANRAHHSDVGGMQAGSMPLASEIFQEGLIIPPVKIIKKGNINNEILKMILSNVRTPKERKGDLMAQVAANKRGIIRLIQIINKYGLDKIINYSNLLIDYTETLFKNFIKTLPDGIFSFTDFLDDDGFDKKGLKIEVIIQVKEDKIIIDFSNSDKQVKGGVNANKAITYSAVLYVLTSLLEENIPINSGIMRPVELIVEKGSILNAEKPAPIAGGNVETSQRIVDVLLGAFSKILPDRIPAASQGTMNNISFGGKGFTYYETIGGGTGAGKGFNGVSAVHSHMTNSLNTPVETIERNFPVIINGYSIRKNSGGKGKWKGGDGIIREYKFLEEVEVSLLTERRRYNPYGLFGGREGKKGENILIRDNKRLQLESKLNMKVKKGDTLIIKTPGGGGYGEKK
jgi:N-methylhydantoinase B/oxoprolinase/acetone carboxylase alpha subunit